MRLTWVVGEVAVKAAGGCAAKDKHWAHLQLIFGQGYNIKALTVLKDVRKAGHTALKTNVAML